MFPDLVKAVTRCFMARTGPLEIEDFMALPAPLVVQTLPFFDFLHDALPRDALLPAAERAWQPRDAVQTDYAHCGLRPDPSGLPPHKLLDRREGVVVVARWRGQWSDGTLQLSIHALNFGGWAGVKGRSRSNRFARRTW